MPTTIVLVRHGETDWNRERRFQGHADMPLNDTGRRQARELADALRDEGLSAVYTSPLRRASETARDRRRPTRARGGGARGAARDRRRRLAGTDRRRGEDPLPRASSTSPGGRAGRTARRTSELRARVLPALLGLDRTPRGEPRPRRHARRPDPGRAGGRRQASRTRSRERGSALSRTAPCSDSRSGTAVSSDSLRLRNGCPARRGRGTR